MISNDQLIAYVSGALQKEERARLEAQLANDETALRVVLDQERLDAALGAMFGGAAEREQVRQAILEVVSGASYQDIKRSVIHDIAAPRFSFRDWLAGWRGVLAGGLAAAACAALAFLFWPRALETPMGFAQLNGVQGGVIIARDGGELGGKNGTALQPGDAIRVGDGASAVVLFADRTRLEFVASSQATFDTSPAGGKQLDLTTGTLTARVRKQPEGKPLIVCTPHATVTVAGTVFKLAVAPQRTRLEVNEGLVNIAHAGDDHVVAVAAGEYTEVGPGMKLRVQPLPKTGVASETPTRDPARWPFAAESPWNRPVGSEAAYADIVSPVLDLGAGATINKHGEGRPVFVARADDPVRRIFKRDHTEPIATLRIPSEAAPDKSPWAYLNLMDEAHRFAYEMNGARRRDDGDIEAQQCFRVDLRSAGVPPEQMGANLSGIPSLAGLIRKGELAGGIRHALACIVLQAVLSEGPDGHAFVWPAGFAPMDPKWTRLLSTTGNLRLGTLLAIPPSVDIVAIGVSDSGPAFEIARALQDYGVYISSAFEGKLFPRDEKKPHIGFWIEPAATKELLKDIDAQLALIVRYLKVVGNNGPASIGGGGEPRRPLAPSFTGGAP